VNKVYTLIFCLTLCCIACNTSKKNELFIIPKPKESRILSSYFNLDNFHIYADNNSISVAKLLVSELNKLDYSSDSISLFEDPILDHSINLLIDSTISEHSEYYNLVIDKNFILIKGSNREGLIHGIYSLIQLIPQSSSINDSKLACVKINDYPKFKWRGLLLDCCRHFMSIDFVKRYIDLLAYHKMNVLHWHLTEDQGWRIEIDKYPKLTEIGAWRKETDGSVYGGFYTKEQIKEVVDYAYKRGVNIVPEIEIPGHSVAALAAYPEYSCTGGPFEVEKDWGVFKDIYCAGNDSTFVFLENVLDEIIELFPSKYIHIGGDEAPKYRWENCSKCKKRIQDENLQDSHELQSYFIQIIENYISGKGKKLIGWDEILEGGLANDATVQSWRGFEGALEAVKTGHDAIVSPTSHAYFDYDLDAIDLEKVYNFDPIPIDTPSDKVKHIIGGECNMWSERAPQNTVDSKVFPRILAMSEVLWDYPTTRDYKLFYERVQAHYKRLDVLGVNYGLETKPIDMSSEYEDGQFYVTLNKGVKDLKLFYQINQEETVLYDSTFIISESANIKTWAVKNGVSYGDSLQIEFYKHKGLGAKISDLNTYGKTYDGGGNNAIVNGLRGGLNFRDGHWQGYFGTDFEATINIDSIQRIDSVISSFYQYNLSWIFMPKQILVYTSVDGDNYFRRAELSPTISLKQEGQFFKEFVMSFTEVEAKYIKIKAFNYGVCPDWHPAAGSKSWLFVDEVRIY
jgi:hexosaminidase